MARIKTKEEIEAEFLKAPEDRTFYQRFAFFLFFLGLKSQVWSWFERPKQMFIRLHSSMLVVAQLAATLSQIVFFCLNYRENSLAELTSMLSIIPISCNITVKLILAHTKAYKVFLKVYMSEIHLHNLYFKDPGDTYVKERLVTAERYFKYTYCAFAVCSYMCTAGWIAVPIRRSIMNNPDLTNITSKLDIAMRLWLPLEYEYNFNNWIMMQVVQAYGAFNGISVMYHFDVIMLMGIYHFLGHIMIFSNKLKTRFSEGLSQNEVKMTLIELFLDFNWMKETLDIFVKCFEWYIIFFYTQNLFQGAVVLYSITSRNLDVETLITFGLMIPYLQGFLILSSYVLEYIRILTDDLSNLVYNIPWEDMSVSNQKMVWMLLFRVQPTLEFTAGCNVKTGAQPAINIIKTTFSYYLMIKRGNEAI